MERTKQRIKIPDIICHSTQNEYTQIPNDLIRNPNISAKAKAILCLLLSNKEGWHSYMESIQQMMQEGEHAIRTGLAELEKFRYLIRVKYRDKKKKKIRGSFWVYTDKPGVFKGLKNTNELLDFAGMCADWPLNLEPENLHQGNLHVGNQDVGKQVLKRSNNKKTNDKKTNSREEGDSMEEDPPQKTIFGTPITNLAFDDFWQLYPKKADKGRALTAWNKICRKKAQERPTWETIRKALQDQKKSERWQNPKYIPHPTTWLNQSRWLDDPEQMKSFSSNNQTTGYYEEDYQFQKPEQV